MLNAYVLAFVLTAGSALALPRRNVLFLLEDDGGFEIGALGAPIATPNLDSLTRLGTVMTNAYTTVSSCSPSRAAIMSGLPSHQNGMFGLEQLPFNAASYTVARSLPNLLASAGYASALLGKYHVQPLSVFNYTWGITPDGPRCCGASDVCMSSGAAYNVLARNITYMKECASDFLDHAQSNDQPWLLYVGFGDSHRCGGAVGEFCELFGIDSAGNSTIPDWTPRYWAPADVELPFFVQDTPVARQDMAKKYTVKNRMDQGIGLLLQQLQSRGLMNDTMIIYTSDNGIPFAMAKTNFYEPGAGVPMIVVVPGMGGNGTSSVAVSTLDILPTILDWTGVPFKPYEMNGQLVTLTGKSILPLLREASQRPSASAAQHAGAPPPLPTNATYVYGSFQWHEISEYYPMRLYKLVYNIAHWLPYPIASDLYASPSFQDLLNRTAAGQPTNWYRNFTSYLNDPRPQWELFDVVADPTEATNLAGDPAYAAILASLQASVKQWQLDTNDYWAIKYIHQ